MKWNPNLIWCKYEDGIKDYPPFGELTSSYLIIEYQELSKILDALY